MNEDQAIKQMFGEDFPSLVMQAIKEMQENGHIDADTNRYYPFQEDGRIDDELWMNAGLEIQHRVDYLATHEGTDHLSL